MHVQATFFARRKAGGLEVRHQAGPSVILWKPSFVFLFSAFFELYRATS